ncbi:MAG: hypothetical protein MZV70_45665 [Desulfobacterales bacterium]|nr:hypothetical protein [Desulfobacterales bacterium]
MTLVRNPKSIGTPPTSRSIRCDYVVTEDVNTELKRYQAGELDATNEIPSDQREAAESRSSAAKSAR